MPKKNYKDEIIRAAKMELAEKGYANLNMRAIANIAGIKAASIYNHFATKDEIIFHLILEGRLMLAKTISDMINSTDDLNEKILAYFDAFIKFGFENKEFYIIMFMQEYPKDAMSKVKEKIAREIEPGLHTLAKLLENFTSLNLNESLVLAESFFHILHGHISLCILNRDDFLFDKIQTQNKIREIILNYLEQYIKK